MNLLHFFLLILYNNYTFTYIFRNDIFYFHKYNYLLRVNVLKKKKN